MLLGPSHPLFFEGHSGVSIPCIRGQSNPTSEKHGEQGSLWEGAVCQRPWGRVRACGRGIHPVGTVHPLHCSDRLRLSVSPSCPVFDASVWRLLASPHAHPRKHLPSGELVGRATALSLQCPPLHQRDAPPCTHTLYPHSSWPGLLAVK